MRDPKMEKRALEQKNRGSKAIFGVKWRAAVKQKANLNKNYRGANQAFSGNKE